MNAYASAISTAPHAGDAAREACGAIRDSLGNIQPDLVVVLGTPDLMANAGGIAAIVDDMLHPAHAIGCTAEGVIGSAREIEAGPALSLWAASLPGITIDSFALDPARAPDGATIVVGWPPHADPGMPDDLATDDAVILLADPFTFPPDALHDGEGNAARRGVIGGMASGGREPGDHRLILGRTVLTAGAVGVVVPGVRPVVSQGCRPIGPEMTITEGGDGVITELAGRPALERVREVVAAMDHEERALVEQGVLAGLVVDGNKAQLEQGDFLIRGIMGGDPESGAIAVGERVRVGQVMRLQVRDHVSADTDLRAALGSIPAGEAGGALVFSCNGRGTRLFPGPDHDALAVDDVLGGIPVAGLFCNGEIGPVGGRAYLHGFTATMAVFPRE